MGFKKVVKKGLFPGVKPKEWLGVEEIKANGRTIKDLIKLSAKSQGQQKRWPSFEKFMHENHLNEAEIQKMARTHFWFSVGLLGLGIFIFGYSFHLFASHFFVGGFVALMLACYVWAYAYAENVRSFKLKRHVLKTTFSIWFHSFFKRGRS